MGGVVYLSISIANAGSGGSRFHLEGNSGIYGPSYSSIVSELNSLATIHSDFASVFQYGKSVKDVPLTSIKIFKKDASTSKGARAVLIGGTIHGDEFLHIEDRLPRWFLEEGVSKTSIKKFLDEGGAIYITPILNPDGYNQRKRENAHNQDLNRDFTVRRKDHFGFREPETKALRDFIQNELQSENRTLALALDYHCCLGSVLRPWSFKAPKIPVADRSRFGAVGDIVKSLFNYKYGVTPNLLGYSAIGTSKDYYYENFGAVGLTFEGKEKVEDQKFDKHTAMWELLFDEIMKGNI